MSVALVPSLCAGPDARALQVCNITTCHASQLSLPDHPFLVLGLVGTGLLVRIRLFRVRLVLVRLVLVRLGICLSLCPVRRGRTLLSSIRLGDYDAISVTRSRSERYKTTILVGTTSAFNAIGELDAQLLRTLARRTLWDTNQYEDT